MYFSHTQWIAAPKTTPAGKMLYAIGDIHGHADELMAMHEVLRHEIDSHKAFEHCIIHLGDYIDRGPDSKKVLEVLHHGIKREVEEIFLVGNHDQYLIELIDSDSSVDRYFIIQWYENGGMTTMRDLNMEGYGRLVESNRIDDLRTSVVSALGPELVTFLNGLSSLHRIGDYVFVHAGIDPSVNLENQEFSDLLLIREPFLSCSDSWTHPFCVIHGHSISKPSVQRHRISVDAGCYSNGALCAVQIKSDKLRFIGVTKQPDYPWSEKLSGEQKKWQWSPSENIEKL